MDWIKLHTTNNVKYSDGSTKVFKHEYYVNFKASLIMEAGDKTTIYTLTEECFDESPEEILALINATPSYEELKNMVANQDLANKLACEVLDIPQWGCDTVQNLVEMIQDMRKTKPSDEFVDAVRELLGMLILLDMGDNVDIIVPRIKRVESMLEALK